MNFLYIFSVLCSIVQSMECVTAASKNRLQINMVPGQRQHIPDNSTVHQMHRTLNEALNFSFLRTIQCIHALHSWTIKENYATKTSQIVGLLHLVGHRSDTASKATQMFLLFSCSFGFQYRAHEKAEIISKEITIAEHQAPRVPDSDGIGLCSRSHVFLRFISIISASI